MKKVILNDSILDLNNVEVLAATGKTIQEGEQFKQEVLPICFGKFAFDAILKMPTQTDEAAYLAFDLASKINANMKLSKPTVIELTDEEFELVNKAISRRELIVKVRFLQMVSELNPI